MLWFLGLFDPGWRDLPVKMSNTEITLLWILAAVIGALLYYFFIGRKGVQSGQWEQRYLQLDREFQDEKKRHQKLKQQLDAAQSKANSFSASAGELDKLKSRMHDHQKETEQLKEQAAKHKTAFEEEHARVTSMMVDHSEVESLKNRVKNQEKELRQSKDDAAKIKAALDLAVSEKVRLTAALADSQSEEMRQKIDRLEKDLQSSRLMVIKYQTDLARFEEDRKRLHEEKEEVDGQSGEVAGLRQKLTQAEGDLKRARQSLAEVTSLRTELEAAKSERDKWNQEADVQARNAAAAFALEEKVLTLEGQLRQATTDRLKMQADLDIAVMEKSTLAEALAKTSGPIKPDNLQVIEGIGPKLEEILNGHRIYTFRQLADSSPKLLQGILDEYGEAYRIHDPETWPEQARLISEGKLDAFEKLTGELKGGRRVE